jgi:hypothetical protein
MRTPIALVVSAVLAACSATLRNDRFHVEPLNRATFSPGQALPAGATLRIRFERLAKQEVFLINRCGTPCNTSKVVASVQGDDPPAGDFTFTTAESGEYYFWMQKRLDTGETGPVFIDKFSGDASSFAATFKSGTTASGELELHEPPAT